jgi:hypothetical protein
MRRCIALLLFLWPSILFAQAEARVTIFDVKDLLGRSSPSGDAHGVLPTIKDIVDHLRARVDFSRDDRLDAASEDSGQLVVIAPQATIDKARVVLDQVRRAAPAYRVTIVSGSISDETRRHLELKDDKNPVFLSGYGGLVVGAELTVTSSETFRVATLRDDPENFRRDGQIRGEFSTLKIPHETADKDKNAPLPIEFRNGAFAQADIPAILATNVGAVRSRKFLTNYAIEKDIEGYPDGVPVPKFTIYEEGTLATFSILPSKDGKFSTLRIRFSVCAIDPVVETYETAWGKIRVPRVKRNALESTLTMPRKGTVLIPAPDWSNVVLIAVHARDAEETEKK